MTTPIGNNSSVGSSTFVDESSATSDSVTSSQQTTDVIESSTSAPSQRMSILEYLAKVDTPSLEHRHVKIKIEQAISQDARGFYLWVANEMEVYREQLLKLFQLDANTSALENSVDELNAYIEYLNSFVSKDNEEIAKVNEALKAYEEALAGGDPDEIEEARLAYNDAVDEYNTWAEERNAQFDVYDSQVAAVLDQLETVNEGRSLVGLDPIELEIPSAQRLPEASPIENESDPVPDPLSNSVPMETIDKTPITYPTLDLFPPFSETSEPYSLIYNLLITIQRVFNSNVSRTTIKKLINELYANRSDTAGPNDAFVEKGSAFVPTSLFNYGSAATGVSIQSFLTPFDFSSPIIQRAVERSLDLSNERDRKIIFPSEVGDDTTVLIRQVIEYRSTSAIIPTLNQLSNIPSTNPNIEVLSRSLLATNIANDLIGQIRENAFREPVFAILKNRTADLNLTNDELDALTDSLTTAVNLNLLNTSLNLISGTFDLKTLPSDVYRQVLTRVGVSKDNIDLATSRENLSINDVLANPINQVLIRDELLLRTNELNIQKTQSIPQITNAIQATIQNTPIERQSDLKTVAKKQFQENGFTENASETLAGDFVQFIEREIKNPSLNEPVNIGSPSPLVEPLVQNIPENQDPSVIGNALASTFEKPYATLREFRENFVNQLQNNGLDLTSAKNLGDVAASKINEQTNNFVPFSPNTVQLDVLQTSLTSAINALALPPQAPTLTIAAKEPSLFATLAPSTKEIPSLPTTLPTINASDTAKNAISNALSTEPTTADQLRSALERALIRENIGQENASLIASKAFITNRSVETPSLATLTQNISENINQRLTTLATNPNPELGQKISQTILGENNSITSLLTENLKNLYDKADIKWFEDKLQFNPVNEPIHRQALDSAIKEQLVLDSTNVASIIVGVFKAFPAFGMPHETIEFPQLRV